MKTMDLPDYETYFKSYAAAYERSLGDAVEAKTIRSFFAESFVAAGAHGEVKCGNNDDEFEKLLHRGYAFYKALGTTNMKVERVDAVPLHEDHDQVRVFYRAGYRKRGQPACG